MAIYIFEMDSCTAVSNVRNLGMLMSDIKREKCSYLKQHNEPTRHLKSYLRIGLSRVRKTKSMFK